MGKKNKIRILFIIDFLVGFGGTEKHLLQLVKNIDCKTFECYLFAFESKSNFLKKYFENCPCHILPFSLNKIYDLQAFRVALKLIRFLKEEQIDIVQTFHFGSDFYGTQVARLAKVPLTISSRRDLGSYRTGHYRIADRLIRPLVHRYLSVCDTVTDSMVKEGIQKDKITRIYNGIDLSEWPERNGGFDRAIRKKLNINKNSFVIGNVSHFRPEKGHDVFFEAIKRLVNKIPNLRVFTLGYPRGRNYKVIVQQDEILKRVVTIDYVEDVKEYISVFDVACLTPIKNEGFSNAILEEMAAGKPVVATDVGGNAEAVVHGETGYIIPPNDVDALVQAILNLYHNPVLRMGMGQKGRERVETYFTLEKMVHSIENYYLKILKELRNEKS